MSVSNEGQSHRAWRHMSAFLNLSCKPTKKEDGHECCWQNPEPIHQPFQLHVLRGHGDRIQRIRVLGRRYDEARKSHMSLESVGKRSVPRWDESATT